MALAGFAPSAVTRMSVGPATSTAVVSSTTALVTNLGPVSVFVAMAASVTVATGVCILPGTSLPLTVSGTTLAAITESGQAALNIASGV